ncbi:MAG: SRPBCC family protein [Bacteroidota bacterium]
MILISNSIIIQAQVAEVFSFLAKPEMLPKWNYYIKKVHKTSGDGGLGSKFHQIRKNDEQFFDLSKFERNKLLEFSSSSQSKIKFRRVFTFSAISAGCLIEDDFHINTGHPLFLQKLLRKSFQKNVYANLIKLKELMEKGQTTLQDGRVSSLEVNID